MTGPPASGARLLTCALLTGLLLTGGLAVRGDSAARWGFPGGLTPARDRAGGAAAHVGGTEYGGDLGETLDSAGYPGGDLGETRDLDGMGELGDLSDAAEPAGRHVPDGPTTDEAEALQVLRRASAAEQQVAYTGTQFISVWAPDEVRTVVVDLVNSPGHGTTVRLRGGSSEQARFVAGPGAQRSPRDDPAAILDGMHTLSVAGAGNSGGRPATIVEAVRPGGTLAARFWIDDASGLLLRREVYAPVGDLTRASGFVDLKIGGDAFSPDHPPALPAETGGPVRPGSYAELAAAGWHCCLEVLAGGLRLTEVRRMRAGDGLHLTYSDGLTVTSVFEQRGELDASALEGFTERRGGNGEVYVRYGLSSSAIWSAGGLVYTVVSDTPYGLERAVATLPHARAASGGVGQRVGRGMDKLVAWLNPFD